MTTGPLDVEIPASLDALAIGRSVARSWLQDQGLDPAVAAELLAVAAEFLLHAIVKAGGSGQVRLTGEVRTDGVRLSVVTALAADDAPRAIALPADPLLAGSIGRRLVEGCCDEFAFTVGEAGIGAECWRRVHSA